MEDNKKVIVKNRSHSPVVYRIQDMGNLRREFSGLEEKKVDFEELRRLSYTHGGLALLKDYLVIKDEEALKELNLNIEPEYFYGKDEVVRLLQTGSMDEFLDCLDFAPAGVIDLIKEYAVTLPLNDVAKRQALKSKLDYDVNKIIEVRQETLEDTEEKEESTPTRRVSPKTTETKPARRVVIKEG